MITLNVGGQMFSTTINSLRKSQYFNLLLNSSQQKNQVNQLNSIFIDRDPRSFYWILNYLRGYQPCFKYGPLSEKDNLLQLLEDAKFYGVKSLEVLVLDHLDPKPSYEDLLRADTEYRKEYENMYKVSEEVSQPKEYCSIEQMNEGTNVTAQIKCREDAIKEWKVQRYMQSCKKMILSFCMILEYMFPESVFTSNLGSTVSKKLNDNTELRMEMRSAIAHYLKERDGKPFSPILKLCLSLILTIFFQGINQPKDEGTKQPKPTLKQIFTSY